jgi:hypothetical protein
VWCRQSCACADFVVFLSLFLLSISIPSILTRFTNAINNLVSSCKCCVLDNTYNRVQLQINASKSVWMHNYVLWHHFRSVWRPAYVFRASFVLLTWNIDLKAWWSVFPYCSVDVLATAVWVCVSWQVNTSLHSRSKRILQFHSWHLDGVRRNMSTMNTHTHFSISGLAFDLEFMYYI